MIYIGFILGVILGFIYGVSFGAEHYKHFKKQTKR